MPRRRWTNGCRISDEVVAEAGGEVPLIETILDWLNETHTRATYSAVAAVIGEGDPATSAHSSHLGARVRPGS